MLTTATKDGSRDGTGLINALLQACPPDCVRPDSPERAFGSRGRQRKRCQEAELAPEHGYLVVLQFAPHLCLTQFFTQGLRSLPRCRIRRDLHISKRREVPTRSGPACSASTLIVPGKTRSAPYRCRSRLT